MPDQDTDIKRSDIKRKDKISKLSKTLNRLCVLCWILLWIEGIIMFIPSLQSLGQTIYKTYGQDALALYLGFYVVLSMLFAWLATKISNIDRP